MKENDFDIIEEKRVSFLKIMGVAISRWYTILASVVISVFLFLIFVVFVINNNSKFYSAEFSYDIIGFEKNLYYDGTSFNYRDLVSKDVLDSIKESDKTYKNVDVNKMVLNSDISISMNEHVLANNLVERSYNLSIKKKYFSSVEQAREFVRDIANVPVEKNRNIVNQIKNNNNLIAFTNATTFEAMVDLLNKQYDMLIDKYTSLLTKYGNVVINNGDTINTLSDYKENLESTFSSLPIKSLKNELKNSSYVLNFEVNAPILQGKYYALEQEYIDNNRLLNLYIEQRNSLLNTSNPPANLLLEYNNKIRSLTDRNVEISSEKESISRKLSEGASVDYTQFNEKLNDAYNKLEQKTIDFCYAENYVVENDSTVSFYRTGVITIQGGMNLVLAAIIAAFVGVFAGMAINLVIDRKKLLELYEVKEEA